MKQIKAYRCDFCGKIVKTKAWMEKHELYCFKNPESKSCVTCFHLINCGLCEPLNTEECINCQGVKCLKGISLKNRLKTECNLYKQKQ